MSSKRSRPYDDPPSPESSEEEEEEEEEEQTPIQNPKKPQSDEEEEEEEEEEVEEEEEEPEEEEEEEEEEENDADLLKKPTNNNKTKVSQPEPESEAGSESESEPEPETNYIAKPIAKELPSSKVKKDAKTTSVEEKSKKSAKAATKPSPKQQGSGVGEDDEDGGEKKALFARVWSFDDELAVLQGMIDFKKGNGKDPHSNSDEFYNFVKQKISNGKFTKSQVSDKIRRLKKKYLTSVAKSTNGKAVEFSDPHQLKGYKLSSVIWGENYGDNASIVSSKVKTSSSNAKKDNSPATIGVVALPASDSENVGTVVKGGGGRSAKKPKISDGNRGYEVKNWNVAKVENKGEIEVEGGVGEKGFAELYPHLMKSFEGEGVPEALVLDGLKNCLGMVDNAVLEEWNKRWKDIRVEQMNTYLKKLALIQEQGRWFANAFKSSKF